MQLNKHVKVIRQLKSRVWVEQWTRFLWRLDPFSSFFYLSWNCFLCSSLSNSTYPYLPTTYIHKLKQEAHSSLKLLQQFWPNYVILQASFSYKPKECDQNRFDFVAKGLYQMINCLSDNKLWSSLKDLTKGKLQKIG